MGSWLLTSIAVVVLSILVPGTLQNEDEAAPNVISENVESMYQTTNLSN